MIRVLNVLFEDRYGGPQKRVIDVAEGLLRFGVETLLLLPMGSGNTSLVAEDKGLKVIRAPFNRMPKPKDVLKVLRWVLLLPRDINLISKVIKEKKIDVVHVNGAFFLTPAIAAKFSGTTLVWHLNDTLVTPNFARFLGMIVKLMADEVIVAAEAVARHYRFSHDECRVIYAPVDFTRIQKKKTISEQGLKVGIIANWNPLKGLDVFVEAASIISEKLGGSVGYSIAGLRLQSHADYVAKVDQIILTHGLKNTIKCKGFVDDINAFLQDLDVLVLSSWSEACPMSVLEAMAAGVAVVATDVGGVKELLHAEVKEHAGFVVTPGSAEEIAEKVMLLLKDNALRKAMGSHGRETVKKYFSIEQCIESHLQIYNAGRLRHRI